MNGAVVIPWGGCVLLAIVAAIEAVAIARMRRGILDAAHEIARPLCALRLGLACVSRSDGAVEHPLGGEIDRAASALDDLRCVVDGRVRWRSDSFDPAALTREIAGAWARVAESEGRELAVTGLHARPVRGDRVRVGQAITNLLANSLEHGVGTVRLVVASHGGRCRIEVSDDGPGVDSRGRLRTPGGRGRGLRIAGAIAEQAGGRLVLGDRTAIELPLAGRR